MSYSRIRFQGGAPTTIPIYKGTSATNNFGNVWFTVSNADCRQGFTTILGVPISWVNEEWHYNGNIYLISTPFEAAVRAKTSEIAVAYAKAQGWGSQSSLHCQAIVSDFYGSMEDNPTPDFKRRSAAGEVIMMPMRSTRTLLDLDVASEEQPTDGTTILDDGSVSGYAQNVGSNPYITGVSWKINIQIMVKSSASQLPAHLPSALYENLKRKLDNVHPSASMSQNAVNRAFGNVGEADLDLAVILAESKQTFNMVTERIRSFTTLIKKIKRGQWKQLAPKSYRKAKKSGLSHSAATSKFLSDAWLEARYGWIPLISDVNNGIKLFKGEKSLTPRQTFRGFIPDVSDDSGTETLTIGNVVYNCDYTIQRTDSYRAGVLTEVRFDTGLSQRLGLFNLATTAWELVPFSFVIDWFINTGSLLAKLNPNPTFRVLDSWVVWNSSSRLSGTLMATDNFDPIETMSFDLVRDQKTRVVHVKESFLTIDVKFGIANLIDTLALLRQFKH